MIWLGVLRRRILLVKWIWSEVFIFMMDPLRLIHPTRVTYTEPAIRGDTSGKVLKPATISTGFKVPVPLFCETGDRIEIDTASGEYKRRITG